MHQYESVDIYFNSKYAPTIFLCDPDGSEENSPKDTQLDIISDTLHCIFTLSIDDLKELQKGISERIDVLEK